MGKNIADDRCGSDIRDFSKVPWLCKYILKFVQKTDAYHAGPYKFNKPGVYKAQVFIFCGFFVFSEPEQFQLQIVDLE